MKSYSALTRGWRGIDTHILVSADSIFLKLSGSASITIPCRISKYMLNLDTSVCV